MTVDYSTQMVRLGLTAVAVAAALAFAGLGSLAFCGVLVWSDDFDDGDLSDWTFVNPTSGDSPITIEVNTEQSVSPPYGFKVSGPSEDYYGGKASGPNIDVDFNKHFTIRFSFRYSDAHWYYLVIFGPVKLAIDLPTRPIEYWDDSGSHPLSPEGFEDYCPANTWTEFRIEVDPEANSYVLWVDGVYKGMVNYGSYSSGELGFHVHEQGGGAPSEPDYVSNGYYDDLSVEQTPVPALSYLGRIIMVILVLTAATILLMRRRLTTET